MSLDPKTNRLDRERKRALERQPVPLEVPFPFARLEFDAEFFDVAAEPPPLPAPPRGDSAL